MMASVLGSVGLFRGVQEPADEISVCSSETGKLFI